MFSSNLHSISQKFLEHPVVSRVRRNHGLEHAVMHILAKRFPNLPMAGYSLPSGFRLVGDVSTEALQEALEEALMRMRAGEEDLAVHPNCGTNFVTTGTLAGLAGAAAMVGVGKRKTERLERLALAAVMATMALIVSQPLALAIQRNVTTSGKPGALAVYEIKRLQRGRMTVHQVFTRG
jgi:hypothetical protein